MKKALITGITGQDGAYLATFLKSFERSLIQSAQISIRLGPGEDMELADLDSWFRFLP
jgi:GDP-D-mannose dehydratase